MENTNKNMDFLQSSQWREFQESVGRKTYHVENDGPASSSGKFSASIIEHQLPIVGKYFYVPRWPKKELSSCTQELSSFFGELTEFAKKENAGWIRIDPETAETLELIKKSIVENVAKAPHDMQPKEVFVIDISKSEEQLLGEMKSKTRYNINVAKKHGVKIMCHPEFVSGSHESTQMLKQVQHDKNYYVDEFLRLTKEMALRNGITAHPEEYYRKMIESLPEDMLKIYAAEFEGQIIAANLILFFGETATYLHGASSNENRNVMAPFLLQWQAILDAKEKGCAKYDLGGISTNYESNTNVRITNQNSPWSGITNFKLGFSPNTEPIEFPGSYDIVINPRKYAVYRGLQRAKAFAVRFRK